MLSLMLPSEQRARLIQELLASRGLNRHSLHIQHNLSRPSIEQLWHGHDVSLETVEKFARALKLPINEWRSYWGYDPLPTDPDTAAEQLLDALDREELTYEPVWEGITAEAYLGAEEMSDNDRRRVQAAMQRVLEADKRRRERGKKG